ncbi:MAG: hydroxyacid dehydrogenase [Chloroflexi bacterium]|jgi:phosphoglycerate dehydrogenase-like enzyme|nr:hydroxyacid dehydrogenase [Chloroflexota bacterium]
MLKGLFILAPQHVNTIYGEPEQRDIRRLVDIYAPPQTPESIQENPALLHDADVIFAGWGAPRLDAWFLEHAPNLKAFFYGSGSIRGIVTDEFWQRGILITSAYAANAVPVAEYCLSQILFSLKHGWRYVRAIERDHKYPPHWEVPGAYDRTVGLISLGMVGRRTAELLQPFDLHILSYSPISANGAEELGIELVSLEDVFRRSDVVSLHTAWLPETEGMITGAHFRMMKPGATFINSSRGAIVNEPEMIAVLQERPDLWAILDVTWPEPPEPDSPLYTLPNVVLTPHIAGSMSEECRRMGRYMVQELERFLAGEPLRWGVTYEQFQSMA